MVIPSCKHDQIKLYGKDRNGTTALPLRSLSHCSDSHYLKPLGEMRLAKDKAVLCLRLLLEGNSIRSVERITRVNRNTILRLLELVGQLASAVLGAAHDRNLPAADIQADEVWGFVGMKEKTCQKLDESPEFGDAYCYTAIERDTKTTGDVAPRKTQQERHGFVCRQATSCHGPTDSN